MLNECYGIVVGNDLINKKFWKEVDVILWWYIENNVIKWWGYGELEILCR